MQKFLPFGLTSIFMHKFEAGKLSNVDIVNNYVIVD